MGRKKASINNLIVISDLHCGCRMGLCPPQGMKLDDGGRVTPSKLQDTVWRWWEEFWNVWIPDVTHGEPYTVVLNGDAVDGVHHNSTTQMSQNIEDQVEMTYEILRPVVEACEGRYYHLRGTEAHVGKSGVDEERLAKRLGAIPDEAGKHARWEMWIRVGRGLVNIMHHIGTAGSMAYETSAVQKELEQAIVEAGRWNNEIPDIVVRSHRHRNVEVRSQSYKGWAVAFTTPGWQLKTPFVFRVAGARQSQPQIGGSLIRCGDQDVFTRHFLKNIARPKIEVA